MVKLVFCLRRRPEISRAEFHGYWRETHGPLVRRHAASLRNRRYVQLHTLEDPLNEALRGSRGGPEAYDGVAELWWERLQMLSLWQGGPPMSQFGSPSVHETFFPLAVPPSTLKTA